MLCLLREERPVGDVFAVIIANKNDTFAMSKIVIGNGIKVIKPGKEGH